MRLSPTVDIELHVVFFLTFSVGAVAFNNVNLQRSSLRNNIFALGAIKSNDLLGLNEPIKIGKGGAPAFSEFMKAKYSGQEVPGSSNEVLKENIEKLSQGVVKINQNTQSLAELNSKAIKNSAAEVTKTISALKAGSASSSLKLAVGTGPFALFVESLKPLIDSLNLDEYGAYYALGLIGITALGSSKSAKDSRMEEAKREVIKASSADESTTKTEISNKVTENVNIVIPEVVSKIKSAETDDRQVTAKVTRRSYSFDYKANYETRLASKAAADSILSVPSSTTISKPAVKELRRSYFPNYKSRLPEKAAAASTASVPGGLSATIATNPVEETATIAQVSNVKTKNVDIAIPEVLDKIKAAEEDAREVRMALSNTDEVTEQATTAGVDSDESIPFFLSNENIEMDDIEDARRKVVEAAEFAEKAAGEAKLAKELSNEIIKNLSVKGGKPLSVLEESKMSLITVENELLEKKVDSLKDDLSQLENLLRTRDDALAEAKAKADKEVIGKITAEEKEDYLKSKIKSLEEENNNISLSYKQLDDEKLKIEKELVESNTVLLSEEQNLKINIVALEKERDDASAALKKLEVKSLSLENEFTQSKALFQSNEQRLQSQIEALETVENVASTMNEENIKSEAAAKVIKRSKAEEKVRALAEEVDAKAEIEEDGTLFFAAESEATLVTEGVHPFASLSNSALGRKTVKDLVAFLQERGVQTVAENGKTYLKKVLLEKVGELL